MLHLTRAIDRATGYVFVPPPSDAVPPGTVDTADPSDAAARPNSYALFSSAAGPMRAGPADDVRDVQERWIDGKEAWDAWERREWRREGEAVRDEAARAGAGAGAGAGKGVGGIKIRERRTPEGEGEGEGRDVEMV
jgi:hypothetical protein